MRTQRTDLVFKLAVGLLALLVVLGFVAVALAVSYPRAAAKIAAEITVSHPWLSASGGSVASHARGVLTRAENGYRFRVLGTLDRLSSRSGESTTTGGASFPVGTCTECHQGWRERPLFTVVYMPHITHVDEGIACETCHESSGLDRDKVPSMALCIECHTQAADGSGECDTCHPPGSLFHGADLAGSRRIGEQCATCHSKASIAGDSRSHTMPTFDRRASSCSQCHSESACVACHPAAHASGYRSKHYSELRDKRVSQIECYRCHDANWCSMRCHSVGAR